MVDKQQLIELIHSIIDGLYEEHEEFYGKSINEPTKMAELSVKATLKILQELGKIELPQDFND